MNLLIKIIFFDVGGVLLHRTVNPEKQNSTFLGVDYAHYMEKYEKLILESEFMNWWERIDTLDKEVDYLWRFYGRLLDLLDIKRDQNSIAYMVNARVKRTYEVVEDSYETLDYLSHKYQLGIITNAPVSRRHYELKDFDLEKYFDPIIISHEVGVRKPNKAIYEVALKKAGLSIGMAKSAAFIDNTPDNLVTARTLGFGEVILYNSGKNQQSEFDKIYHFSDLKRIF